MGTGQGYSVLDVVSCYREVSGREIAVEMKPRRAGDLASCYAQPTLARELIGWQAQYDLATVIRDSWNWTLKNPDGYNR